MRFGDILSKTYFGNPPPHIISERSLTAINIGFYKERIVLPMIDFTLYNMVNKYQKKKKNKLIN